MLIIDFFEYTFKITLPDDSTYEVDDPYRFLPVLGDMDYNEIREDRVLIFAPISRTVATFTYRAQLTVAGEFTVPPITVTDMYNSAIRGVTDAGKFTVSNAQD